MKNQIYLYNLIILFLLLLFFNPTYSQKNHTDILVIQKSDPAFFTSAELFPLDISLQLGVNFNNFMMMGIEGNAGVNLSNYIIIAGEHFGTGHSLINYKGRDEHGRERYYGFMGFSIFGRFLLKKRIPLDIGIQREFFSHSDDSSNNPAAGQFNGIYSKIFFPVKFKEKENLVKVRPSFGIKISAGFFEEATTSSTPKNREFGVMTDLWFRFYLTQYKGETLKL